MDKLSMTEVWDDSRRFLRNEQALLWPIGLAGFGLSALILAMVVPVQSQTGHVSPGPWMLGLIPAMLLVLTGYLAMSRIALQSRITVAEALSGALRLLPRALGIVLIVMLVISLFALLAGLISAGLITAARTDPRLGATIITCIMLPFMIWASARLALLWAVLADRETPIGETFKISIALTRGHDGKFIGLLLLNILVYVVLTGVLELAGGSILLLLTRVLGVPGLGPLLVAILMAAFNAAYMTVWAVFLARLYNRLAR